MSSLTEIDTNLLYTILKNEFEDNTIQKVDSNFYEKTSEFIGNLKKQEYDEMRALISDYRRAEFRPRQVVGDDTIKGVYGGDNQFVRTAVS